MVGRLLYYVAVLVSAGTSLWLLVLAFISIYDALNVVVASDFEPGFFLALVVISGTLTLNVIGTALAVVRPQRRDWPRCLAIVLETALLPISLFPFVLFLREVLYSDTAVEDVTFFMLLPVYTLVTLCALRTSTIFEIRLRRTLVFFSLTTAVCVVLVFPEIVPYYGPRAGLIMLGVESSLAVLCLFLWMRLQVAGWRGPPPARTPPAPASIDARTADTATPPRPRP